jgi:GDP-L-fucose synthase
MGTKEKIFVAGHRGLVGSAIVKKLQQKGYTNLILKTHDQLDLLNQQAVADFFEAEKPEKVFLAAAKVGGIMANKQQKADFIYKNLQIQNNVIFNCYKHKVNKLLFLGSSCIYPRNCAQPIKEEYLLTGPLEQTNDAYAVAKIAGITMCQSFNQQYKTNFISAMPTNLYGPNDNFDPETGHVLPALIRKFHEAKQTGAPAVILWGTGTVYREFLHVDDLADALLFLMQSYNNSEIINVGTGTDITIKDLAETIKEITGYEGQITWDKTKPDGTPKKLLDVTKLNNLGWKAKISLKEGITQTYEWFKNNPEWK